MACLVNSNISNWVANTSTNNQVKLRRVLNSKTDNTTTIKQIDVGVYKMERDQIFGEKLEPTVGKGAIV